MNAPSPRHIDNFFDGMRYAENIARQTARGQTGAHAIRKELTTLELYREQKCKGKRLVLPTFGDVAAFLSMAVFVCVLCLLYSAFIPLPSEKQQTTTQNLTQENNQ